MGKKDDGVLENSANENLSFNEPEVATSTCASPCHPNTVLPSSSDVTGPLAAGGRKLCPQRLGKPKHALINFCSVQFQIQSIVKL